MFACNIWKIMRDTWDTSLSLYERRRYTQRMISVHVYTFINTYAVHWLEVGVWLHIFHYINPTGNDAGCHRSFCSWQCMTWFKERDCGVTPNCSPDPAHHESQSHWLAWQNAETLLTAWILVKSHWLHAVLGKQSKIEWFVKAKRFLIRLKFHIM